MSDYESDSFNIQNARADSEEEEEYWALQEEADNARYKDFEESELRKNAKTQKYMTGNKTDLENVRRSCKDETKPRTQRAVQFQKRYNKYLSKYKAWKKYAVNLSNDRNDEIDELMKTISCSGCIQVTFTVVMIIIYVTLMILFTLSNAIETKYFI
jgi:hypothetical protein